MNNGWTEYRLEDALEKLIDYRGKTPVKSDFGVPLITAKVVKDGRIETPNEFIAEDDYEDWMRRGIPKYGDVVLTTEAPLGEVAQIKTNEKVALAQRIITLRGKKGLIDNTFLKYFLLSPIGQKNLKAKESGSTVTGIKQSELRQVLIYAPDFDTQREIAGILSAFDDKIELNRRMNQTLETIAQTLFTEWFVKFNLPGFEGELVDGLPKGWRMGIVSDLFELQRGFDLPTTTRTEGKFPVVASSGIASYHNEFKVSGPGVTTGRSGVIGNVYYIIDNFWPLNTSLFVKNYKLATPLYAFHLLKNIDLTQLNGGSAVPTLNRNDVHGLSATIPVKTEILNFEAIAKSIYSKINLNTLENQTLTRLRDNLLPRLLSGQIRV